MNKKEISMTVFGASGFIGRKICMNFSTRDGYQITAVKKKSPLNFKKTVANTVDLNSSELDNYLGKTDVVINLSGANILEKAWTKVRKKELKDSRILTTRMIKTRWINALTSHRDNSDNSPPNDILFLNASAVGYYNSEREYRISNEPDIKTETSSKGDGFLSDLTDEWEREACFTSDEENTLTEAGYRCRSVQLRFGLVLGKGGGALPRIVQTTKWMMGAVMGSGEQLVSWIALSEVCDIVNFLIHYSNISGPVNVVAPQLTTFRQFAHKIGEYLKRPVLVRVPGVLIKKILGDRSDLILKGNRVYPEKLLEAGYVFSYPNLSLALKEELRED